MGKKLEGKFENTIEQGIHVAQKIRNPNFFVALKDIRLQVQILKQLQGQTMGILNGRGRIGGRTS